MGATHLRRAGRRAGILLLTVLAGALLVFLAMKAVPGDPALAALGEDAGTNRSCEGCRHRIRIVLQGNRKLRRIRDDDVGFFRERAREGLGCSVGEVDADEAVQLVPQQKILVHQQRKPLFLELQVARFQHLAGLHEYHRSRLRFER